MGRVEGPIRGSNYYLPPPSWKTEKMDKTIIEGVFLGWKLNPGATWEKDYYVAPLSEFNQDTKRGKTNKNKTIRKTAQTSSTCKQWPHNV